MYGKRPKKGNNVWVVDIGSLFFPVDIRLPKPFLVFEFMVDNVAAAGQGHADNDNEDDEEHNPNPIMHPRLPFLGLDAFFWL